MGGCWREGGEEVSAGAEEEEEEEEDEDGSEERVWQKYSQSRVKQWH